MESAFISSRPDLPQKLIYFWKSYSFTCDFYSALNWKVCQAISSLVFCACEFSLLASSYGDLLDMYSLTPQSFHSLCSHFCQPLTVNSRFNSKGKEKLKKKMKRKFVYLFISVANKNLLGWSTLQFMIHATL